MTLSRSLLSLAIAAAAFTPTARAEVPLDVIADTELYFDALLHFDAYQYSQDISRADGLPLTNAQLALNTLTNNGQMRRGEMVFRGRTAGGSEFQIGYDTVGSRGIGRNGRWLDVSWRGRINAASTWRVGQFKQPNSLEELTSTRSNEFVSKATITNAFGLSRRVGAEYQYSANNVTATATWFTREINVSQRVGTGWGSRLTWAPILNDEAGEALHVGLSGVRFDAQENRYILATRPQADITNVATTAVALTDADDTTIVGLEGLYYRGPFKVMGEYMQSTTRRFGQPDFVSDGWYVSGLYTFGPEKFTYRNGVFNTAMPSDPVRGMWQVGARYDELDANDGAVLGGAQSSWTVGANWYIRSHFRLSLNYVMVDSSRVQNGVLINNDPNILELRAQIAI